MADPCAPLAPCNDLDGKLLMQRSVYGPQLAFDPGTVPLAGLSTRGAALRGVLDLLFEVRWRSTGLCQGPATSVMGLAPGEVVTVGLRTRSTRTFSSLIRDAAESSRSSSHSDRETGPAQKPAGGAAGIGGIIGGIVSAIGEQALTPDRLGRLFPQPNVRVVHVFAGVHVEAVPGNCVLPDIPDHLRIIVPGATQYHPPVSSKVSHAAERPASFSASC